MKKQRLVDVVTVKEGLAQEKRLETSPVRAANKQTTQLLHWLFHHINQD
jgi:hypothetical protein